jgi:hypothetical protein
VRAEDGRPQVERDAMALRGIERRLLSSGRVPAWRVPAIARNIFARTFAPLGRLVALECNTGDATTTAEQRECHAALRGVGVVVSVVRSVEDARRVLAEVRPS